MSKHTRSFLSFALGIALILSFAPTTNRAYAEDVIKKTFVGKVTGEEDVYVAVALEGTATLIYICDGRPDKETNNINEWFKGELQADNTVDLTNAKGNRVVVTLSEDTASGQFIDKNGGSKKFDLVAATAGAGLLRSEFAFGDQKFVTGWVILLDGSSRGYVEQDIRGKKSVVPAPLRIL